MEKSLLDWFRKFLEWLESLIFWIALIIGILAFIQMFLEDFGLKIHIPFISEIIENNINIFILVIVAFILKTLLLIIKPDLQKLNDIVKQLYVWLLDFSKFINNKTVFIEISKHPEVWDSFVNTYYVVNAPWQLEFHMKNSQTQDLVKIHAKRYCRNDLKKVYYIFFKNSLENGSLKNFYSFIKEVRKICPLTDEKIEIILLTEREPPPFSLFVGEKSNLFGEVIPYSIIYIHAYPFLYKNGVPSHVIVSTEEKIYLLLSNYIEKLLYEDITKENNIMRFKLHDFIKYMEKK